MSNELIKELSDEWEELWDEGEEELEELEELAEPVQAKGGETIVLEQIPLLIEKHRDSAPGYCRFFRKSQSVQKFFGLFLQMADAFTREYERPAAAWASVHMPKKEISVEGRMELLRILSERILAAHKELLLDEKLPVGPFLSSANVIREIARAITAHPSLFKKYFEERVPGVHPGGVEMPPTL